MGTDVCSFSTASCWVTGGTGPVLKGNLHSNLRQQTREGQATTRTKGRALPQEALSNSWISQSCWQWGVWVVGESCYYVRTLKEWVAPMSWKTKGTSVPINEYDTIPVLRVISLGFWWISRIQTHCSQIGKYEQTQEAGKSPGMKSFFLLVQRSSLGFLCSQKPTYIKCTFGI